jgi:microcystin-dependent protein
LPAHSHGVASVGIPVAGQPANSPNPSTKYPAIAPGAEYAAPGLANGTIKPIVGNTATAGANQPVNIGLPVLAVNFIIALYGIFPSRS